ncbi:MAG: rhomboid family intramembrane serine protease [Leptospirales bacterium]|jgi:membrane associated rhomboid family serine protease
MEPSQLLLIVILIAANLVVSMLGFRAFRGPAGIGEAGASGAASVGALMDPDTYLFIPHRVARGEKLPGVVVSNLSHAGWLHLVFNMFALFSFAGGVLGALGSLSFILIYVIAGIGCNLVVYALRKNDPAYRCLGASGSVFGIVTAAVVLDPTISIAFLFVPIPIPGPVFMLAYVLISLYLISRNVRDGISHEGHLGGALAGFVVTGLISPAGYQPLIQWIARSVG